MIDQIAKFLVEKDGFVVVTHVNPDGDAIGSLLGMYLSLKEIGKKVVGVMGANFPESFAFLPGNTEMIVGWELLGFNPSCVIAIDVADRERIAPSISGLKKAYSCLINIDHHPTNPGYGDINFIRPHANSSTQLVYELLCKMGYKLNVNVSKCLYTGLVTDTGCFKFSGVTSRTFELAAKLLAPGVDSYDVTKCLFEELPESRLTLERLMLERLEFLLDGKLALSYLDLEDYEKIGASLNEGENIVNRLRETRGVEVGGLITALADNSCKVSLRSKGMLDVSTIASKLGGGGHRRAAGIKSSLGYQDMRLELISLVKKSLENEGV
ncbi:MAG: bifunctional oligoribonuclease/PAP phosphatase NrnA [Pseudomonadota bacterium]